MLKPRIIPPEANARSTSLLVMSLAAVKRKRGNTLSWGSDPMAAFTASNAPVASACQTAAQIVITAVAQINATQGKGQVHIALGNVTGCSQQEAQLYCVLGKGAKCCPLQSHVLQLHQAAGHSPHSYSRDRADWHWHAQRNLCLWELVSDQKYSATFPSPGGVSMRR